MNAKVVLIPNASHPITVERHNGRVAVRVAGKTLAETTRALVLQEAAYGPVYYIPREDADMTSLERSTHTTYCPYKGDCSYYSIPAGGQRSINAVWTYEAPYESVAAIRGHLAFYPNRVDAFEVESAAP